LNTWFDGLAGARLFAIVAIPLFAAYLLTATWTTATFNDTYTNALSAWNLGTRATFSMDEHAELVDYHGWNAWIVHSGDKVVSMYPPGVTVVAAPLYAIWPVDAQTVIVPADEIPWGLPQAELAYPLPPPAPAVVAAAATTAAAIGFLAVSFSILGASGRAALAGAYLAGLGTAAWSVASDQLWQHGPAMMWIALGLVLSARRPVASGLAWGAAILTRPPVAVMAAAVGLMAAWKSRSWRPAFQIGAGACGGLALYLAYNAVMFGEATIGGGYGSSFATRSLAVPGIDFVGNLFLAGFSPYRGLFVWSPFLLLLLPGLRRGWQSAPGWVRGGAVGGLVYLLLQYKANRYSGGFAFPTYRYPLEGITAMAPLLFLSYREWVASRPRAQLAFLGLALLSAAMHLLGAIDLTPLYVAG
jgi:hypothetical protein